MVTATVLAIFMVPVFFVSILAIFKPKKPPVQPEAQGAKA
jgi:hypothetical protein